MVTLCFLQDIRKQKKHICYNDVNDKFGNYVSREGIYMKNKFWVKILVCLIILIIFLKIPTMFAKPKRVWDKEFNKGSNIKIEALNNEDTEKLNKLCKIWGFTKYYHPKIVDGSVNWDYELFRVMPKILEAENTNEVNNVLYKWINNLGEFQKGNYDDAKEIKVKADTDWIEDKKYLGEDLSSLMMNLSKTYITEREKGYVNYKHEAVKSNFDMEEAYPDMRYDDDGFKLLSLFRYWNIIQYYNPYRDVMGEDWNEVLNEFIPKFLNCNDELSYKLTVAELTARIHDSHASLMDERKVLFDYFGRNTIPVRFSVVQGKIIVTEKIEKYKMECNLEPGDIILKVDGRDIFNLIKEKSKYIARSRDEVLVNNFQTKLFGTNKESLMITIDRDGEILDKEVKCHNIDMFKFSGESHKLIDGNIGYINPGLLKKGEIDKIMTEFMNTEGLIIDLRYYPSDFITKSLAEYLLPQEEVFARITMPNRAIPGEFIFMEDQKSGKDNKDYYKGKVIIINNECTQSNAEFTTMSFRNSPNSLVIGENTIGADGDVAYFKLPGGITTVMTGLGVYNPDGSETQRVGLTPDIYIKPTIEGIREGRDELLEKSIDLIKE